MAKITKEEVAKRALKRAAMDPDVGYLSGLGQAYRDSAADLGQGLVGRGAGYLNTLQKVFTGVDANRLKALQDRGTVANDQVYQDILAAGGEGWAKAYAISRELGISFAEAAALGGLGKGVRAISSLKKGAKAAQVAEAATKAGVASTAVKGLWNLIKGHKVASVIAGAGLVGAGIAGVKARSQDKKATLDSAPQGPGTGQVGLGGDKFTKDKATSRESSPAARTFEDFIKAALTGAGFGTPEAKAYHYDPWGQTGGNAPYQAALTGGHAYLNPNIAGGRAPTIRDIRGLNMGTHEQQRAYEQMLYDRSARMQQAAENQGAMGYAAYQQGQGLQADIGRKQSQANLQRQALGERALYREQMAYAKNEQDAMRMDAAKAKQVRDEATLRYGAFLAQHPETEDDEALQEGTVYG